MVIVSRSWLLSSASILVVAAFTPRSAQAQTIGPGTITTPQTVTGFATVVGNTTIAPPSGTALTVVGGGLAIFDSSDGPIALFGSSASTPTFYVLNGGSVLFSAGSALSISNSGAASNAVRVDPNTQVVLSNVTIRSTGGFITSAGIVGAYGVIAFNPESRIALGGGSVTTTGQVGVGVYALSGEVLLNNVQVATQADAAVIGSASYGAYGVNASLGGRVEAEGGSISTAGTVGIAARAAGAGSIVGMGDVQVTTLGRSAYGTGVSSGATALVSGTSIDTSGAFALGFYSSRSSIVALDTTIVTRGDDAYGAGAGAAGIINMAGGSITTAGARAVGFLADQTGTRATATDVTISTGGVDAFGANALNGGNVTVRQGSIQTTGLGAHGAAADGAGSMMQLLNLPVTTSGAGAHGAEISDGGALTASNVTVNATGNQASALFMTAPTGVTNTASFSGASLTSAAGPAMIVSQGGAQIDLTGTTVTGNGQWLSVGNTPSRDPVALRGLQGSALAPESPDGLGELASVARASVIRNGTDPAIANITVSGSTVTGAAITAAGSTSSVTLLDDSTWNLTGNSNLTNLVNDPSLIQFSPPVGDPTLPGSYKTLTVVNYTGMGGIIALNTRLGADASPSDRLVIDGGTATGNSPLRIANTGGGGAVTTGNGILVVDAINGGTTAPGTFALAGTSLLAGPYEYRLFRSSVDGSNAQAWYLRSTIDCALHPDDPQCRGPSPPGPSPPGPGPTPGPEPGPGPAPGPEPAPVPNFRPETSFYAAIPSLALLYGRNVLDTLHERVGDEEDIRGRGDLHQTTPSTGMWGRIIGTTGQQNSDPAGIYGAGPQYKYDFLGLQAGQDLFRSEHADGSRDHAGVYFAIGSASGHVTHFDGALGTDSFQAYTLGGYWTHFGATGWYVDTVLQGTYYDVLGGVSPTPGALQITTNGRAIAASVEGGYKFNLPQGYFIEPQAQLVYQNIDLSGARDAAAQVRFDNADSLAARIGARIGRTWSLDDERGSGLFRTITAWLRPNVWHEFRGDPLTQFSSDTGFVPFRSDLGGSWGELNAGVNGQINRFTTLFANASWQQRFEGKTYAYDGKLGIRVNW